MLNINNIHSFSHSWQVTDIRFFEPYIAVKKIPTTAQKPILPILPM